MGCGSSAWETAAQVGIEVASQKVGGSYTCAARAGAALTKGGNDA